MKQISLKAHGRRLRHSVSQFGIWSSSALIQLKWMDSMLWLLGSREQVDYGSFFHNFTVFPVIIAEDENCIIFFHLSFYWLFVSLKDSEVWLVEVACEHFGGLCSPFCSPGPKNEKEAQSCHLKGEDWSCNNNNINNNLYLIMMWSFLFFSAIIALNT